MILSIREMAQRLDVHEQTLRNWERQGLLTVSRVGRNRTRVYGDLELSLCKKIQCLSQQGINLRGIKVLLTREKVGSAV